MLDDLEANVDTTDSKLQKNLKRLKKFVRETEGESAAGGTVCVSIPYGYFVGILHWLITFFSFRASRK